MANIGNECPCLIIDSYRVGHRRGARDSFAFGAGASRHDLLASGCVGRFTSGDDRKTSIADVEEQAGPNGRVPTKLTSVMSITSLELF